VRTAIVQDTNGFWFVRELASSTHDAVKDEMVYYCSKHLAGPFDHPIDAAHWIEDNVEDEDDD
jgi:hypothetical protein